MEYSLRIDTQNAIIRWWVDKVHPGLGFTSKTRHDHHWHLGGVVIPKEEGAYGVLRIQTSDCVGKTVVLWSDFYRYQNGELQVAGIDGPARDLAEETVLALLEELKR
jgi:hypothetical protein